MSLLVSRIPRELSYDILYSYFAKFGRINDFRIRNDRATLIFDSFSSERDVQNVDHEINGYRLLIELDKTEKCINCPVHCSNKSFQSDQSFRNHSGHPLDINKIVLENIPECSVMELKDFVRSVGLDPVYARITHSGKHGIVEFKSIDSKNDALRELEGINFRGSKLTARPYFNRERNHDDYSRKNNSRNYRNDYKQKNFENVEKTEKIEELKDWNENVTRE